MGWRGVALRCVAFVVKLRAGDEGAVELCVNWRITDKAVIRAFYSTDFIS